MAHNISTATKEESSEIGDSAQERVKDEDRDDTRFSSDFDAEASNAAHDVAQLDEALPTRQAEPSVPSDVTEEGANPDASFARTLRQVRAEEPESEFLPGFLERIQEEHMLAYMLHRQPHPDLNFFQMTFACRVDIL